MNCFHFWGYTFYTGSSEINSSELDGKHKSFEKIFSNPPNNPLTVRSLENTGANYFSQPHSEIIANRINFFSQ